MTLTFLEYYRSQGLRSRQMRTICLFLFVSIAAGARAQAPDSKEEFINATFLKVIMDTSEGSYYLIKGSDTCWFEKFDYDEWVKYHLQEQVPLTTLNELAYKVHIANEPYYWQQDKLKQAKCITAREADSLLFPGVPVPEVMVFSFSQPQFTDDGQYAVIDMNWKTGPVSGTGYTFLLRHKPGGWRIIGSKLNWSHHQ